MKATIIGDNSERTYAIIFDKGDEFIEGLLGFAREQGLDAAHLTAIGGFSDVTLGYFDRQRKTYKEIPLREQVEVLSLVGDIAATEDGTPQVHAHVVVGDAQANARGGHIMRAHVWPTLEVVLQEAPAHLRRKSDPETGLALIDLPSGSR